MIWSDGLLGRAGGRRGHGAWLLSEVNEGPPRGPAPPPVLRPGHRRGNAVHRGRALKIGPASHPCASSGAQGAQGGNRGKVQ